MAKRYNIQYPISNIQYPTQLERRHLLQTLLNHYKSFYSLFLSFASFLFLSFLGVILFSCVPLSDTIAPDSSAPPAAPTPTTSITVNYSGLHYVHFTADDPNVSADKTVGFLITPTDSSPSKAVAETKKGYITRKFRETQKSRNVFMFLHEGTAYSLGTGSTDIPFTTGATASDTNFETTDILQENTAYKIRMYDGDEILEKTFTTKSFSAGDASSEGAIAYLGGLIAATKAAVSLTIERKPEEIMLIPYANDTYGGKLINYYENASLRAGCSPGCGTSLVGVYIAALRKEANQLVSLVFILSPQRNIAPTNWTAIEQARSEIAYNIEIISE
ncbi:hypothetical protein P0082_08260 [Candidatus Haliotispira prima]|uniref:Uncharacterized protein n=1 Tax=Candidatus Haliotispira prima TaxID=3034016 RepID=A0ABY8MF38_9SPIO|nr:hypothetical protein P0082_08260 [Candidatus Haliotispira prima]